VNAPRRAPRRKVDGVLLLDKPCGITSNAALQAVRRAYNAEKAGHTGTLDPLACGLLPLCFGEATKFAGELLTADKEYEATMCLGVTTDSADSEGTILERRPVSVDLAQIDAAFQQFTGSLLQLPPMYSALKRNGKPLYEYARAGIDVERSPRAIVVHRLELMGFADDQVSFRVACSKGTYVRTLAEDLGSILGCGAHLTALKRTRLGRLHLSESVSFDRLNAANDTDRLELLQPVDSLLGDLPLVRLGDAESARFGQGQSVPLHCDPIVPQGRVRVFSTTRFLGLGETDAQGCLHPKRLIAQ
jgi:tRNA pseudouridine55 synthase